VNRKHRKAGVGGGGGPDPGCRVKEETVSQKSDSASNRWEWGKKNCSESIPGCNRIVVIKKRLGCGNFSLGQTEERRWHWVKTAIDKRV